MPLPLLALLLCSPVVCAIEIAATPRATLLPVTAASRPLLAAAPAELAARGYVEQEYLVSGTAAQYQWPDSADRPAYPTANSQRYVLRILVRRPQQLAQASGRVVVELLEAAGAAETAPLWSLSGAQFMRQADVWVGVSVQRAALDALRRANATRYAALTPLPAAGCSAPATPGSSWDAIAQVGALLRSSSRENPLADLRVQHVVLAGQGQAASVALTYLHGGQHQQRLGNDDPVFDAALLLSLSQPAAPLGECDPPLPAADPRQRVPGVSVPVVVVNTQADAPWVGGARAVDGDSPLRRVFELAAAPAGALPLAGDSGAPCVDAANGFPTGMAVNAIWAQLAHGLSDAIPLAQAAPLQRDAAGRLQLDPRGNALGGVRLPPLSVPLLTYGTSGQARDGSAVAGRRCALAGSQRRFDSAELKTLYGNRAAWLKTYQAAIAQAVAERWLVEADAAVLRAQAATAPLF